MTLPPIEYRALYNEDNELPEPRWGGPCSQHFVVQCPWCGSSDMYYSGSADNPDEVTAESVRCKYCGHITDYYEAFMQRANFTTDVVREVVGRPE